MPPFRLPPARYHGTGERGIDNSIKFKFNDLSISVSIGKVESSLQFGLSLCSDLRRLVI